MYQDKRHRHTYAANFLLVTLILSAHLSDVRNGRIVKCTIPTYLESVVESPRTTTQQLQILLNVTSLVISQQNKL